MKIKQIDKAWDVSLWIVYLAVAVFAFVTLMRYDRGYWVNYELPDGAKSEVYAFTDESGQSDKALRYQVWEHRGFQKPAPAMRDFDNVKTWYPKDEYYEETVSQMPASQYPKAIQHFFWLWFVIFAIVLGIVVYRVGYYFRNIAMLNHLRRMPDSGECADYLKLSHNKRNEEEVRKLMAQSSVKYLNNKENWHYPPYMDTEWRKVIDYIVVKMVDAIHRTGNNTFPLEIKVDNTVVEQDSYLRNLMSISRAKGDANDMNIIAQLQKKKYVSIADTVNQIKDDFAYTIGNRLTDFFADIIGDQVFRFNGHITKEDVGSPDKCDPRVIRARLMLVNNSGSCYFGSNSENYPYVGVGLTFYFPSIVAKEGSFCNRLSSVERFAGVGKDFRYTKDDSFTLKAFYGTVIREAINNTEFFK